jgi:hypothetical protein
VHVDPEKRQKVTSLLYRAIESARNEQMYKDINKRLNTGSTMTTGTEPSFSR